ncbi:hypothetical protein [uncultured Merdimonas sp.]|uniref:hypothetical protein n=1 Tax=uncultured Merdimonas sp. TaxID=2023269 RepID=UPI00320A86AA
MKKNNMHKAFAGLLAMIVIVCAVIIGWAAAEPEQTKPAEPEPLVINTVQRQDDMLLTVIQEDETVFQYAGDIELWKCADGKAYGIIYLDEEVLQ